MNIIKTHLIISRTTKFAIGSHGVVSAIVADSSTHIARFDKNRRIEVTSVREKKKF